MGRAAHRKGKAKITCYCREWPTATVFCRCHGTGKTVTLRVIAEHLSRIGVPVFMADVRGIYRASPIQDKGPKICRTRLKARVENFSTSATHRFLGPLRPAGPSVRTTISDMGPLLISRLLKQ